MDLLAALRPEDVNGIIGGDPDGIYRTIRGSTATKAGIIDHVVQVSNADLALIFKEVSKDADLVRRVLEEARLDSIEIAGGATSSTRPIQFTTEMLAYAKRLGGEIPGVVATNLRPAVISFIIHRFGNKLV
ncbi:hypothetical protein DTW90_34095 [Neorhizobium sp. P12A]|uniref:hypothetical protein n=1 Tax=Neorhizobium sp. P12A TaxID=2268027 RepID=UPI0011F099A3|nr:hypothetical protein [Neorhizobium sp. P12A]KAA0686468.1 hypothetical protein DTW90_34095 [Neorhizobium sp. P12A]